jgi:Raf kinase inhibitor-like YbhB/YbcL family protein
MAFRINSEIGRINDIINNDRFLREKAADQSVLDLSFTLSSTSFGAELPGEPAGAAPNYFLSDSGPEYNGTHYPQLSWSINENSNIKEFVMIMTDINVDSCHWLIYNIKPTTRSFNSDVIANDPVPLIPALGGGTTTVCIQGNNDYQNGVYTGPFPPGETHKYRFTMYAINKELEAIQTDPNRDNILTEIQDNIISKTSFDVYATGVVIP